MALVKAEGDAVDGLDVVAHPAQEAGFHGIPDLQIVDFRDHRGSGRRQHGAPARLRGQELARIGVLRIGEDLLDRALLHDMAPGHDADPLGHLAHDIEIMGDEQQRHAKPRLEVLQQPQNLGLDGDIQRRGRLVGDQ